MTRLLAAALGLAISLGASVASAQEDPRALFREGQAAYDTGDYATAAQRFEQAYALDARPALQYNLAQACERLGDLTRAVAAYRRYIETAPPDASELLTARARMLSLEQRLAATAIVLSGGPEGATVLIDDEDRGRLPHPDPFRIEPGSHRVVVRAEGHEDFVANVAVTGGQVVTVAVDSAHGGGGGGGVSTSGIVVTAVGGATLIAGAITGAVALSTVQSAPSDVGPEADQARALALATDVLIPVGAVAAATGVVLMFVLGGDGGGEPGATAVVPSIGPGHAGILVQGSF
jgi:hypothetical protein